jgi:hypothetical protein
MKVAIEITTATSQGLRLPAAERGRTWRALPSLIALSR